MSADSPLVRQSLNTDPAVAEDLLTPVKTANLSHRIVDRFVQAIERDELTPGRKLPSEKELMNAFQVGRSTVREALHSLVTLRLVEVRPGKGYYVRETGLIATGRDLVRFSVSEKDFLDVMEAQEEIEPRIAHLAAQRALPEDLQKLEDAYAEIEAAAAKQQYRYTGAIHLGIVHATHNPVLVRIMETLLPMFPGRVRGRTIPVAEELQMHRKLIDGLRKGNGKTMERLMLEHIRTTREFYVRAIDQQREQTTPSPGSSSHTTPMPPNQRR